MPHPDPEAGLGSELHREDAPPATGAGARGATETRRSVIRDAAAIGVYGVSFEAIGIASGLSVAQTCVTAVLLGSRNAFYGVRLADLLRVASACSHTRR